MIDRAGVEQIEAQYAKHGWQLRRVLLSPPLRARFADIAEWFRGVETVPSELDGLWFSRSSRPDTTAWELRHLSTVPYALVTGIPNDADPETAESILKELETRMFASRRADGPSAP